MNRKATYFRFMVLLTVLAAGFLIYSIQINKKSQMRPPAGEKKNSLALVPFIPHFNDLRLSDLDYFTDYRQVYEYNNHLLVIGLNKIVEFDPGKNKLLRINDSRTFGCINETTLIGDTLYVSCYVSQRFPGNSSFPYSVLYALDLKSGALVKTFFDTVPPLPSPLEAIRDENNTEKYNGRKINMYLAAEGTDLWMSFREGVMKMDTVSQKVTNYAADSVLVNSRCHPSGIFNDKGTITVLSGGERGCDGVISVFNKKNNTWEATSVGYEAFFNKKKSYTDLSRYALKFPAYYALSPKINDTYYALASDGIYSLKNQEFPVHLITGQVTVSSNIKPYVSDDQRFLIFFGAFAGGPRSEVPLVNSLVDAYLIDLQEKTLKNLVATKDFNVRTNDKMDDMLNKLDEPVSEEKNGTIFFKDKKTGQTLAAIDLLKATLTIGIR